MSILKQTETFIATSQRRRRNKVDLTRELIGCRDVWENIEWKGLPTLDMGLAVLQTANEAF